MERIVIEVDEAVAKKWRRTSPEFKKEASEKISESISKILDDNRKKHFLEYLDELRSKMKQRGLTEEILQEILNDE